MLPADSPWRPVILYAFSSLSLLSYLILAYLIERHHTWSLMGLYLILFASYIVLYTSANSSGHYRFLLFGSIIFRLIFLVSMPELSDDIYRFIWDGRLWVNGINAYTNTPDFFIAASIPGIDGDLYEQMNSPHYYTVYPPFSQFIFWISALWGGNSVLASTVVMRIFIILFELGNLFFIKQILSQYNINTKKLLIYALNPLIILELTGNLHGEVMMIFFLLASIWLYQRKRIIESGLNFGLSIASKMLTLMLSPLWIRRLGIKNSLLMGLISLSIVLIAFLPMIQVSNFGGIGSSFALYFQKFEFNASIYYLVRVIGFHVKGYNIIASSGKWMAILTFTSIMGYSLWERNWKVPLPHSFLMVFTIYLIFATTVHPWYITTLVCLSVFTPYYFPVVWSFFIFLTYAGYHSDGYLENLWLVSLEYLCVAGYLIYELKTTKLGNYYGVTPEFYLK